MRITDVLVAEHQALYRLLDTAAETARSAGLREMKIQSDRLFHSLKRHGDAEHELLFAALGKDHVAVSAMRNEHVAIEDALTRMQGIADVDRARLLLVHAIQITRDHMDREEQIYFKRARQALGDARLEELGNAYLRRRTTRAAG